MVTTTLDSKAFIFDLDGTLIDTTPLVVKFWTELANENNLDVNQVNYYPSFTKVNSKLSLDS